MASNSPPSAGVGRDGHSTADGLALANLPRGGSIGCGPGVRNLNSVNVYELPKPRIRSSRVGKHGIRGQFKGIYPPNAQNSSQETLVTPNQPRIR
jgi:hypothetical protein